MTPDYVCESLISLSYTFNHSQIILFKVVDDLGKYFESDRTVPCVERNPEEAKALEMERMMKLEAARTAEKVRLLKFVIMKCQ
jgi:hypothetical protein